MIFQKISEILGDTQLFNETEEEAIILELKELEQLKSLEKLPVIPPVTLPKALPTMVTQEQQLPIKEGNHQ
jgi:hypothetical protein